MTKVDENAQNLWDDYTAYKQEMFKLTNTEIAPWEIIDANQKPKARLLTINHILESIPYNSELGSNG